MPSFEELLYHLDGYRRTVDEGFQKLPFIPGNSGLRLGGCLGNIVHLFGVETLSQASILPLVRLSRFQNQDGLPLFRFEDLYPLALPVFVVSDFGSMGRLNVDEQRVLGGVTVKAPIGI